MVVASAPGPGPDRSTGQPSAYRRRGVAPLDYPSCRGTALGVALGLRREEAGLDLPTAAGQVGVPPEVLTAIEEGTATPTADTLFALADAYRTDVATLFASTLVIARRPFDDRWRYPG